MKTEILLLRAYGKDRGLWSIPWGIIDIASYLKKYGYEAKVMDRTDSPYSINKIKEETKSPNIAYVGISAMTSQSEDAAFLCRHLKKRNKNVILGGLHYSIYPEEGLKIGDYVFKGEGERSLLDFLENGPTQQVYESQPLLDLDEIPLPDEALINKFYLNKENFIIMTSRGCPYNCSFCLDKKYRFDKLRYHSAAYVCDLIEMLNRSFAIENFGIADDIFTINKKRAIEICREIKKRALKIKLRAFTHSGIDDLELYKEMKDAGFETMILGVESGSDEVLKMMNKQQTVAQVKKTVGIIKKSGLEVSPAFMVGNMLETEESLKATLNLARELKLPGWVSYAQPFPGTKFYEDCLQYGKIINNNPAAYWNDKITFIPRGLSRRKLKWYHDKIAIAIKARISLIAKIINLRFKNG